MLKNKKRFPSNLRINSIRGMSLVEVLVVCGIGLVITLALMTLLSNQQQMQKRVMQKYELIDLSNTLRVLISQPNICLCNLGGTNITFDTSAGAAFPQTVPLTRPAGIESSCSAPNFVLAPLTGPLPGTQTGLSIQGIQLADISPTGTLNQYHGKLQIISDVSSVVGAAIQPTEIPILFMADTTTPGTTHIAACNSLSGSQSYLIKLSVLEGYSPPGYKILPSSCKDFLAPRGPPFTLWLPEEAALLHYTVNTSCGRFCTQGCVPSVVGTICKSANLSPPLLPEPYKIGFATECGPTETDENVLCNCSK